MTWRARADALIQQVHDQLPPDADLATRKRELRKVAGLFHGDTSWGRKVWAARRRVYLAKCGEKREPLSGQGADAGRLKDRVASGDITFPFRSEG